MRFISFLSVIFVLLFTSMTSAESRLSKKQILEQITNQPFIYRGSNNGVHKEGRIVYERNGTMRILTRKGYVDGGTWRIISGQMCTRVSLGRAGRQVCFNIYAKFNDAYSTSHNYRLYPIVDNRY